MRRVGFASLSVFLYIFLVGMGGVGTPLSIEIPEPATNYAATVVDISDMSTRLEEFSFGGQTFVSGRMGDADISVSFDKIASMGFTLKGETLTTDVQLKDGNVIPVVMEKGTTCYGRFEYGDFRIVVEDIRSITLHGKVSPK